MTLSLEELVRANNNGTLDGALQSRGELPIKVLEEVLLQFGSKVSDLEFEVASLEEKLDNVDWEEE